MTTDFYLLIPLFIATIITAPAADSDTRSVEAEFDRCSAVIERFERSLRRYEDAVDAIKRNAAHLPPTEKDNITREAASLENRLEYFRNRFERANGQADKIRGDLKNVSGPTCPSCVVSSVNLYCRNGETMQSDIEEYLSKAADLQNRINAGQSTATGAPDSVGGGAAFFRQRAGADTLLKKVQPCDNPAAITLRTQGAVNLQRADSLYGQNNPAAAGKTLDIAVSLLQKALERCEDK
jgi:hypothetical protein